MLSDVVKRAARFLRRVAWYLVADIAIVVVAYRVALPLRFAGDSPAEWLAGWRYFIAWIVLAHLGANLWAGVYHRLWRYASAPDALVIAQGWVAAAAPLLLLDYAWQPRPLPLSTVFLGGFLSLAGFALLRYRWRLLASAVYRTRYALARRRDPRRATTNVLIFGAGETGQSLSWQLQNRRRGEAYRVVGFVDDDQGKVGLNIHGSPVLGVREQLPDLVAQHRVDLIILAIQAISGGEFREVLRHCQNTTAQIKIVPDLFGALSENAHAPLVRDVTVADLLGRNPTEIDLESCRSILQDRVVCVTGGAGSIGAELCRQVITFAPRLVVAVDINESALYELQSEMQIRQQAQGFSVHVADITDRAAVTELFGQIRPQVVFHAAAYKHVPLMESHPRAALHTNVAGTLCVGRAAAAAAVERFVYISTDKAVNPSSVMGASKLLGECVTAGLARAGGGATQFTAVRFGNVLGSRGSVAPLFERQISAGGPLTVTHPEMTRYFMTLPEATRLVIQAAALTRGGDLFMLDMGERIRILELAERMVRLRGLRPDVDIPVTFIGLRPGEKLHEELIADREQRAATSHPHIFKISPRNGDAGRSDLNKLESWLVAALQLPSAQLGAHVLDVAGRACSDFQMSKNLTQSKKLTQRRREAKTQSKKN